MLMLLPGTVNTAQTTPTTRTARARVSYFVCLSWQNNFASIQFNVNIMPRFTCYKSVCEFFPVFLFHKNSGNKFKFHSAPIPWQIATLDAPELSFGIFENEHKLQPPAGGAFAAISVLATDMCHIVLATPFEVIFK